MAPSSARPATSVLTEVMAAASVRRTAEVEVNTEIDAATAVNGRERASAATKVLTDTDTLTSARSTAEAEVSAEEDTIVAA